MPASEQTWRSPQLLHRVFGASGVALLFATMWMFYADNDREWKAYQDASRQLDLTYNDWSRLQFETNEAVRAHELLASKLVQTRTGAVSDAMIESFAAEARRDPASEKLLAKAGLEDLQKASVSASQEVGDDPAAADVEARTAAEKARSAVIDAMQSIVDRAKFREDKALNARKFRSADLDQAKAQLDIAVRDNLSLQDRELVQARIDQITADLARLQADYQAAAAHRRELQRIVRDCRAEEDADRKLVDDNQAELRKLKTAYTERRMTYFVDSFPWLGKAWLSLPILDAFNSPRKIENLWSDDLTIDYNFRRVRRFDRCTTCHQSMEKTQPGTADKPLFEGAETFEMALETPTKEEVQQARDEVAAENEKRRELGDLPLDETTELLERLYGLRLADQGLIDADAVTINYVREQSRAAKAPQTDDSSATRQMSGLDVRKAIMQTGASESVPRAGLRLGDVIRAVGDSEVDDPQEVVRMLLETANFGKPAILLVRRGFDNPYSSHPRLDLFVSSVSPHKMSTFACTVCHEGQGSATAFKWASHAPSDVLQEEQWKKDHGWFDNHHWIYPMYSKRFAESACLKCHHDVVELEASERFPDTPAPKVTHGYQLVRKYGCYGCHEIKGFEGPTKRIGPDLRLESNYFAAALQLKSAAAADGSWDKMTPEERSDLEVLVQAPEREEVRHRLYEALQRDEKSTEPRLTATVHRMAGLFKDEETPGDQRRPGPSLRFVGSKSDEAFLADWIREPKHFRPSTRMPQFFELWSHLSGKDLDLAKEMEPVEILGMVEYLKSKSQSFDYLPEEKTMEPAAESDEARLQARLERGKEAFQQRGCLACHTHADFPDVAQYRAAREIVQGPDLTGLGSKFAADRNANGRRWLYSWIKQPTKYHPRTVMPDLYLSPIEKKDETGKVVSITDPAADIVDYLMSSTVEGWTPKGAGEVDNVALNKLMLEHLLDSFYKKEAEGFAQNGIPPSRRDTLKSAERELVVADGEQLTTQRKLTYIGVKSIGKYGCFGCHDIPGFEDAKPIGTGLADWGRKEPAKLAFEHITHFLDHGGHGAGHPHTAGDVEGAHDHESAEIPEFYKGKVEAGHREGFIWQKLAEPRSYDYMKTENKRYNERLRMPKFPFKEDEREAVITFILGLVADPPAPKYLYRPTEEQQALINGKKALDKFNCGGCHVLQAEVWKVASAADEVGEQASIPAYPFLATKFSVGEIEQSKKLDAAGRAHMDLVGMPALSDADALPMVNDNEEDPLEDDGNYDPTTVRYPFDLWKPTLMNGNPYEPGVLAVNVSAKNLQKRYPAQGGVLARYLIPHVTAAEKKINPAAKGTESWAWVPPPLIGEGNKVQSAWLHEFLLNPYPIRPAVVLRMPRFNMSSAEASHLVEYFSALDNAEYPYSATERRQSAYLNAKQSAYSQAVAAVKSQPAGDAKPDGTAPVDMSQLTGDRFQDALRIVTNGNYCVKCHLVGEFEPAGGDRAKAPNLAKVAERLRPDYLRDWIANPKKFLPYTSMPINVPYNPDDATYNGGVAQNLYHGTSTEQVDALVDLLMNYDRFAKSQTLITPFVRQQAPPAPPAEPKPATDAADSNGNQ